MLSSVVVSWGAEGGYKCRRHPLSMGVSGAGCSPEGSEHSSAVTRQGWDPCSPGAMAAGPSQCRALLLPVSLPHTGGELQSEGSIFILVLSPSWVALQAEKSFTAFYFSLSSLLMFHFCSQICSSQPLWTKPSELEISVRFCCIIFPSPWNDGLLFLLEKCNQCSAWRPGHCVWPFCFGHWPTFHSNTLVNSGTSYVSEIYVTDRERLELEISLLFWAPGLPASFTSWEAASVWFCEYEGVTHSPPWHTLKHALSGNLGEDALRLCLSWQHLVHFNLTCG